MTVERVQMFLRRYREVRRATLAATHRLDQMDYKLGLLDKDTADVLRYIYIDGCTWKQAASLLNVSMNTLYSRRLKGLHT